MTPALPYLIAPTAALAMLGLFAAARSLARLHGDAHADWLRVSPRLREMNEQQPRDQDAELFRTLVPMRVVDHHHDGSNSRG